METTSYRKVLNKFWWSGLWKFKWSWNWCCGSEFHRGGHGSIIRENSTTSIYSGFGDACGKKGCL